MIKLRQGDIWSLFLTSIGGIIAAFIFVQSLISHQPLFWYTQWRSELSISAAFLLSLGGLLALFTRRQQFGLIAIYLFVAFCIFGIIVCFVIEPFVFVRYK